MNYLMAVLAAYRLALMLATEEGPGGAFDAVRSRFDPEQETWLGRGLNCPLCIGFWVSLFIAVLWRRGSKRQLVLDWWGIAGGMTALHVWLEK